MLIFLRSTLARVPVTKGACAAPAMLAPPGRRRLNRALAVALLLPVLVQGTLARAAPRNDSSPPPTCAALAPHVEPQRKRIIALRHDETPDGALCTLTSDAPLDDYKSYAEGERFFVLVPRAALAPSHTDLPRERGFADLRVEELDGNVLLSFRLQTGATAAVNQSFNRLVVLFITNEESDRGRLL